MTTNGTKTTTGKATKGTTTTTNVDPVSALRKGYEQRVKDAEKAREGLSLAEVAVEIAEAEQGLISATDSLAALEGKVGEARTAKQEREAIMRKQYPHMASLALGLNPDLTAPATGRNLEREAVNRAVREALGTSPDATRKRVGRWVMAGSLYLKHGTPLSVAYTMAGNLDGAAFWAIVEGDAAPTTQQEQGKRKPSTKGQKQQQKPREITAEEAAVVVAQHRASTLAKATPAQRGAALVAELVRVYGEIQDGLKDGSVTLTKAQTTKVESAVKALAS